MKKGSFLLKLLSILILISLTIAVYLLIIRPWQLHWGATAEEIARAMPGDELVHKPTFQATRAVTIKGSPEDIWPWLVQMGYGRAGFYGYDLIENLGSERGLRSAERILPELQALAVGDTVPISAISTLIIQDMKPNEFLVWIDNSTPSSIAFTWVFAPVDENHTRLINRVRFRHHWNEPWIIIDLFTDFADHVAVRKVLLGIKDRVEGRVEPMIIQNIEIALWMVTFIVFIIAFILVLVHKSWWRDWLLALAAITILLITLYVHPPLWLGIFLEVLLLTGLVWSCRISPSLGKAVPS